MKLLPPADLLQRISGVEQGLKDNQKGGRLAGVGLVYSLAQLAVALDLFGDRKQSSTQQWLLALGVVVLGASLALLARSRVWIRESSRPFRFTCSVAPFQLDGLTCECRELPIWLRFDLAEKLNERIRRLSFLEVEQREAGDRDTGPPGEGTDQHIHISGEIVVRKRKDDKLWIEVAPRVRVGKTGEPATLANSVTQVWTTTGTTGESVSAGGKMVEPKDYEKILERVYFNLASHIYRQIESDIRRKISLLPGKYLKATAYLNEADDYGNSNTLDGLDNAIHFYRSALALYDPAYRPRPTGAIRRAGAQLVRRTAIIVRRMRAVVSVLLPRLAKKEVQTARAEIGLANALLHRRTLAGLSGRRLNTIYEAPVLTSSAIHRLESFPEDAPGRRRALFDAYVGRALAHLQLETPRKAADDLESARRVMPSTFDQDAPYLYVQGLLEALPASAVRFLRLAVERQPRFEVAHFHLAVRSEMVWRARPELEEKVARVILEQYDEVLKLNPGNVSAAGHAAYINWLLENPDRAMSYYEHGSEFKGIKPETAIGEIDYGMARVAVEEGATTKANAAQNGAGNGASETTSPKQSPDQEPLFRAYRHYVRAATAQLLQGVSDWKSSSAQFYFFDAMSDAMMRRYDQYYERATEFLSSGPERRVRETVMSFVANDYGEACYSYYLRNYDPCRLTKAQELFGAAKDANPDAILPYYNMYLLCMYENRFDDAIAELRELRRREPCWADALLAGIASCADAASKQISRRLISDNDKLRAEIQSRVKGVTSSSTSPGSLAGDLRRLLPHSCLWSKPNGQWDLRWSAFSGRNVHSIRWEEEFDELHVQAMFKWAVAWLIHGEVAAKVDESSASGAAAPTRPPGAPNSVPSPEPTLGTRRSVQDALSCIEDRFWPGNFALLFTLLQLESREARNRPADGADTASTAENRRENIADLVQRWLKETPTAYWALELVVTDFFDFDGEPLEVFEAEFRKDRLVEAKYELERPGATGPSNQPLLEWVNERLKEELDKETRALAEASA